MLKQQLILLLNGHSVTLIHLSDMTSESHSVNQKVLEKLVSTEISGVEKFYEEILLSTSSLRTSGWRLRAEPLFSKIRQFCKSSDQMSPLSISKLELFVMPPRLISAETLLSWFEDISLHSSNLNLPPLGSIQFPSFSCDHFLISHIRQALPQSPFAMALLFLHASSRLGQSQIWILLANQLFSLVSGPFRNLITTRNSKAVSDDESQIFQFSLICSITIRTFFFLRTIVEELPLRELLLSSTGEVFQSSLFQWLVFLSALRGSLSARRHQNPLHEFVSQVSRELQYLLSFSLRNSLLHSSHLRFQLLYSAIACSPVDISEMILPSSSASQSPPRSILETNVLPCLQILSDLLLGETKGCHSSAVATVISFFSVSILKNLKSLCGGLQILSEDSA